jgi:hypothetical protein
MLFTVLGDTGLLGLFIFLALAIRFIVLSHKKLILASEPLIVQAFAQSIGLVALFFSYLVTSGLLLPLTWLVLGMAMAHLGGFPGAAEGLAEDEMKGEPCA